MVYANYLRSHFFISQPNTLRCRAKEYLSHLRYASCSEESYPSFCFPQTEFLAAATNLSSFTVTGPNRVTYPILMHLRRCGTNFLLLSLISPGLCISFLPLEVFIIYSNPQDGKISLLTCFLFGLYLSSPVSQSCLSGHFIPSTLLFGVISFSLTARLIFVLVGLVCI